MENAVSFSPTELKNARQMKENTCRMARELQLQFDFLHNNLNVILESIYTAPEIETLEVPRKNQRMVVDSVLKAHTLIQSEYEAAATVNNVLTNWQEFSGGWEQRVNNLNRNVMNLRRSYLAISESLDMPIGKKAL